MTMLLNSFNGRATPKRIAEDLTRRVPQPIFMLFTENS